MGDGSHVGLQQALSFESGTHEPANSFASSNVQGGSNGLLIEHFPGDRHRSGNTIGFDIYTCHLYFRSSNTHGDYTKWNQVGVLCSRLWLENMGHIRSHG